MILREKDTMSFYKSRCIVLDRDRDVIRAIILQKNDSNFFFRIGGGVCTSRKGSIRGIILALSTKFIRILLLDPATDIATKTLLFSCDKIIHVKKNVPGSIYNGVGSVIGNFKSKRSSSII